MEIENFPEQWVATKFTTVLDIQGGTQPPKSQFIDKPKDGYVRLLQIRDFGNKPVPTYIPDKSQLKKCETNDLLIGRYGASLGRICTGMEGAYNVALAKVVSGEYLDRSFLKGYLESELFQLPLSLLSRSAQNGFNKEDLASFDFALPPLAEQKFIAERLDTLLAQVETTKARLERIPEIIKRFRQSVLAAAVSGRLTEEWREKHQDIKDWNHIELSEAANIIDPHPSHRTPPSVDGGVPYIGIGDLRSDGSIDFENARKVSFDILEEHNQRYSLKEGDFVFGKIGTLGKATILPIGIDYTLSANVILIQPLEHLAEPKYLQYFLSSPSTMDEIAIQANSTSQAAFGIKKMKAFKCRLPSKPEQTEIVRRVERLFTFANTIEQKAKAALERVNNLTQSILAKAFRGELTADWRAANPDLISGENSAEALLERIKAERVGNVGRKRR